MKCDLLVGPKEVVVRKDHPCQGCGKKIVKGEKAIYTKVVTDDGFFGFWECHECHEFYNENCCSCKDFYYCIGENYEIGTIKQCKIDSTYRKE